MKFTSFIGALTKNMVANTRAYRYVAAQLIARGLVALAQLYAIFVFSKIHSVSDAALIFVLLGYGIWVQVFEFGLSQTIQNGLNSKVLSLSGVSRVICMHGVLMLFVGTVILIFPECLDLFQGGFVSEEGRMNALAFPIGLTLMLVTTNTVLLQRMLLVINRGLLASKLLMIQAVVTITVLSILQWRGGLLIESVVIYLLVPILVHAPITIKLIKKFWNSRARRNLRWRWTFQQALGFWGLNALTLLYLGADYFFAAKYLAGKEMIAYHFASRLFFISFVAYFAYVQFGARGITVATRFTRPDLIWSLVKSGVAIGLLSVSIILASAMLLSWSEFLNSIGAKELLISPYVLSAALYYGIRVFRDVGLVVVWNLGIQRVLYIVHVIEVIVCFVLLGVMAPTLGGVGIFYAMAIVALLSSILIYASLGRALSKIKKVALA
jgi:hypothetical protein